MGGVIGGAAGGAAVVLLVWLELRRRRAARLRAGAKSIEPKATGVARHDPAPAVGAESVELEVDEKRPHSPEPDSDPESPAARRVATSSLESMEMLAAPASAAVRPLGSRNSGTF